jgi:pilus assembly protein CpaE
MALFKKAEARPNRVYAVATALADFDLLIEDLDLAYPEDWGSLDLSSAAGTLATLPPEQTDLIVFAVTQEDEENLDPVIGAIEAAKSAGHLVLLIVDEVSARGIRELTRAGVDDFAPYPMPEGELQETIAQTLSRAERDAAQAARIATAAPNAEEEHKQGVVMPVYGVAGGVGSTTFSVNLANEIAIAIKKAGQRVVLVDAHEPAGKLALRVHGTRDGRPDHLTPV